MRVLRLGNQSAVVARGEVRGVGWFREEGGGYTLSGSSGWVPTLPGFREWTMGCVFL